MTERTEEKIDVTGREFSRQCAEAFLTILSHVGPYLDTIDREEPEWKIELEHAGYDLLFSIQKKPSPPA